MGCQVITRLVLDEKSQKAISEIKRKSNLGNALAAELSVGVFANIFTKSSSLSAAYNISQTDWKTYAQAMRSVPELTKRAILKKMQTMIVHYEIYYDHRHLNFWKGLYNA